VDGDTLHRPPQGVPHEPATGDPLAVWANARGGRLLVVDDSATNRIVIAGLLRKSGFSVETAEGGAEAIAAVADSAMPFDAVLMDVAMPDVDGLAATRAIRAMAGPRGRIPIIAVTAHGFDEDRARCLAAGMNEHVVKPVRRADLLAALERWLEPRDAGPPVRTTTRAP